ncbi:LemA family protein [Sphingomonas morindae]|uniref:LemA family protein n=1 Tax=Sphingomonas morindae TaxID=1541170 RepID=A0ABY4X3E5_9SPHN|nr:LemA family protein [Sphingomonas morindae]USI71396.1 LemA family protein [Sphingomonas morindae]
MPLRPLPLLAPLAALSLAGCGVNTIPAADETVKAKWADVQSQYQRRADLVPNLVATVKGYATHEQATLTGVTEARARATSVTLRADDLSDPAKMRAFQDAQNSLSGALGRLLSVKEAYPDLKADQQFLALQSQLEGTENRINVARQDYNEAVRQYNTLIRTFPTALTAKIVYGATPKTPYEATSPGADQAPKVSF